jgi:hypothetical protein
MVKLIDTDSMYNRIERLLSDAPQRDPYKRFTILAYQLADVGRDMRYSLIYPDKKRGYLLDLKSQLSDLLIQAIIMCRLFGFNVEEMLELGTERLDEYKKRADYKET